MNRVLSVVLLSIMASAAASERPSTPVSDEDIIGVWAQGKPGIHIDQVMEFRNDHTLVMYPRCGQEAEELRKRGMSTFPPMSWRIDGQSLSITISYGGHTKSVMGTVKMTNGVLSITDDKGNVVLHQRYARALPPVCPLRP